MVNKYLLSLKDKFKTFDGGVEFGGVMVNKAFQDFMLLNIFFGGKSFPLLHIQYVPTTSGKGVWIVQYLFVLQWMSKHLKDAIKK